MGTVPETDWREARRLLRQSGTALLDVRSPREFALGHAPGAQSAPLLDDVERHDVGLCYKLEGRQEATSLGLSLFAAKAPQYLDTVEGLTAGPTEAIVQCWRGGMRSRFVAMYLASVGFRPVVVAGGYKAYRREVLRALESIAKKELLVLDGRTGAGKSDLLRSVGPDVPLLDFERIARHRGSAFGDFAQAEPVPTQQNFENELGEAVLALGEAPRILIEIENFLGPLRLPLSLRETIVTAPTVLLERDFDDRVERLASEYAAGWTDAQDVLFVERCQMLKRHVSKADLETIITATRARDFRTATSLLLTLRYDKVYDKGLAKRAANVVARFNLTHEKEAAVQFLRERML